MAASPAAIYRAWTEEFGSWFVSPGVIRMRAEEDEPFFFEAEHEGRRHAHHGWFLTLEQDRLIELAWITGSPGTAGAETVVTVQLDPADAGTQAAAHNVSTTAGGCARSSRSPAGPPMCRPGCW